jgi:signal transduction histidine kinase
MKERPSRWLTSLTAKYIAVFVLLVLGAVAATASYLLYSSYETNKSSLLELQQERATTVAALVEQFLKSEGEKLRSLGPPQYLTDRQLKARFALFLRSAPDALSVAYYAAKGRLRAQQGTATAPAVLRCGKVYARRILAGAERDRLYGLSVSPLFDCGIFGVNIRLAAADPNGIFEEQLDAGLFRTLLLKAEQGAGHTYAVDENGELIADPGAAPSPNGRKPLALSQVQAAVRSSASSGSTTGRDADGEKVLTAFATVKPVGWRVLIDEPESAAFAPLRGKIWRTALLLTAFVCVAIVLSLLLVRRLVRPIKRMQVAAASIGAGAYDERIELDRRDELGALADEFNSMAASLEESQRGLERKVEERTHELQIALEQLAEKTGELEVASKHKSDFMANMSHELRTPLNAIVGFSQVLKQKLFGPVNEKQDEYLDDILSSADHLLALINDILDLSKVEAGQVELEVALFSLRESVERGVVMVRERATTHGIALQLHLDPAADLIEGDERRIRQVVFNLLSNAVKFTPEGGRIDVTTAAMNGEVRVSVEDTGPGIEPEDQDLIFEEFQQARGEDGHRPEGTGLGLALSKQLVALHGGRMWVESERGKGSTFTFTIPVGLGSR